MFGRGFLVGCLLLSLLAISGVSLGDNKTLAGLAAAWVAALPPGGAVSRPGPRRYPPAYRAAPKAWPA